VGKSSLLLTQVIPALQTSGYLVLYVRLLGDPAGEVKAAAVGVPLAQLAAVDTRRPLREVLAAAAPADGRLIVVLDQFEEFFIRQGEAVRLAFAQELAGALYGAAPALDLRVVLSLRDDYLGALDELNRVLAQDVFAHRYKIENLTRDQALLAIQRPAAAFGLPIETSLLARLLDDLFDHGLEPASLQIVLDRLYRDAVTGRLWSPAHKAGAGLTLARYAALGETHGILAGYLDAVLDELPTPAQRAQAQAILKSMVTAGRTKTALSGCEIARGDLLARLEVAAADVDSLLAYLRQARVVRKFGDEDEERYELAHDVLVEKVWAWVSQEELRLLDVRDLLRRELANYAQFGHLLGREKLALLDPCRQALALDALELEVLLRSALAAGHEMPYWFGRAQAGGVDAAGLAQQALQNENFRVRAAAVAALSQLGLRFAEPISGRLVDPYPQVRLAAIHALERLQPAGGWRQSLKYECYVAAGRFIMGDDKSKQKDERPAHVVYLDAYYIGKYPVTNRDYKRYMDERGRPFAIAAGKEDHPVVYVSWFDAQEYAAWANMRLPSEAEWEKAASWVEGDEESGRQGDKVKGKKRLYPWGHRFDQGKCNSQESGIGDTTAMGAYSPQGDSAYGVADMAGNVWEWCADWYEDDYYSKSPAENPGGPSDGGIRVVRGGSYHHNKDAVGCGVRDWYNSYARFHYRGFRVVASPSTSDL
jgi:iron(II)-dependent oxidoreductase